MNPPIIIEKFLYWTLPNELKDPVLGDLAEEYLVLKMKSSYQANYWYAILNQKWIGVIIGAITMASNI